MCIKNHFNIKRFGNSLMRELNSNVKAYLLIIGAMFSLFTIIMILVAENGGLPDTAEDITFFHSRIFTAMLFTGGVIITSMSFIELRSKMKSHFYLMLPSSTFEKFLANLLITLVGYVVALIAIYTIYGLIFNYLFSLIYDINFPLIQYSDETFTLIIKIFISVHSIVFLGAVFFRKYPLIVTPIAVFAINVVLVGIFALIKWIIFGSLDFEEKFNAIGMRDVRDFYESLSQILAFYVLPPTLWLIAFLKLKEKEY